ncbi:unnamed protein product [Gordionus sp. m RMFG-2023]|uniref:aspartyl aminopeptidase-like n=1 Tax=Gordionus sp. m RMFG-2023 TaxID=3053472 RepID=UPI0030E2C7E0
MEDHMLKAKDFINFVNSSPSPWHTVDSTIKKLVKCGFEEIKNNEIWNLKRLGKYYITKNRSTIIAFTIGNKYKSGNGFSIIAAHTDSPSLRLKPVAKKCKLNYQQLGVQLYGGGIWYTWFDRDLTLAGRVIIKINNNLEHRLFNAERPLLKIPTIAIHLHNEYFEKFAINKETHLTPILGLKPINNIINKDTNNKDKEDNTTETVNKKYFSDGHNQDLMKLIANDLKLPSINNIVDMELCLADTQPATLGGINNEFIFSPRLDNLLGSFTALEGFIESLDLKSISEEKNIRVLALYDNEEVGSQSTQGAASAFTHSILKRLVHFQFENESSNLDAFETAIANSFLVSSDQAHAINPNYCEKHEENHQVKLDKGFVIKHNANQKYATTAITSAILKEIAQKQDIPLQEFVIRNDSSCGSTIGPIQSALLGIQTVDVGGPQLSMHSIRETCAAISVSHGIRLFKAFYENFSKLDLSKLV